MNTKPLTAAVLAAALLAGCAKELETPSAPVSASASPFAHGEAPNEIIIRLSPGASAGRLQAALDRVGGRLKKRIHTRAMKQSGDGEGLLLLEVPEAPAEAAQKLHGFPGLAFAEPNEVLRHEPIVPLADADDPYYSGPEFAGDNLWGMMGATTTPYQNKYASRAGEAWAAGSTSASSVYVAVIDEGIYYNHPDLAANIWTNASEAAGTTGVDDDGNGYVDDIHGYDFANNDGNVYDAGGDDHGTHVAGTIGAVGNNTRGVAGVCWSVGIISAKFLGSGGGTTADAIEAIDYVTALKADKGLNIVASNNSWGGGSKSTALQEAITRSEKAGILFVAAAGNSNINNDRRPHYPASYTNAGIISVASISVDGSKSSFSNYGATSVDIAAPGSYIWSTTPGDRYGKYSGTSMATPHVTGAIALYAAKHYLAGTQSGDLATIKNALMASARPTKSFSKLVSSKGRLDVLSFVLNTNNRALAAD